MVTRGQRDVRVIGRYALYDEIAAGGMATVHLGRLVGQAGFSRTVAIKRLHAAFAKDPDFVSMFMDEARLAGRIHHPNVVSTLDVVAREGELFLVMEYILGESLWRLLRNSVESGQSIEPRIGAAIVAGFLHGLHAAHEARSEQGDPLQIVHRDVSPQNVLVGVDGVPRVVDFGIAKAVGRTQATREGQLKGKLPYMSPEQIQGIEVTRATDIYAASIVLWELLAGKRLFARENDAAVMMAVLTATPPPPSEITSGIPTALDRITMRGLSRSPAARFRTARDMALDLEASLDLALPSDIGAWVQRAAGSALTERATRVAEIESASGVDVPFRTSKPPALPEPDEGRTLMAAASGDLPVLTATRGNKHGVTVALAVALVLLVVLVARTFTSSFSTTSSAAASGAPVDSAQRVEVAPPVIEPSPVVVPVPPPAAPPVPPATASVAPPVAPSPAARPPSPPSSRHGGSGPGKCDPPYRVDASGHNIFKLECL